VCGYYVAVKRRTEEHTGVGYGRESSSGAGEIWGEVDMKGELYKSFEVATNHETTLT
jgi:hypothetical protein